tara:strand:- start:1068 stop:1616 length:549 start_codon:yes stop_codon:yes gene_type:complete
MYRDVKRVGYVGKKRNRAIRELNERYGKGNWRIVWRWAEDVIEREEALTHYEGSYVKFFDENQGELDWLVRTASDVYDMSPNDIYSGTNYDRNQRGATHIQDIAIRRAVIALGREFEGDHLVQIRENKEGGRLNPGRVPFYMPEMVVRPKLRGWWNSDSIEDFWQSNKVLQAKVREKRRTKY